MDRNQRHFYHNTRCEFSSLEKEFGLSVRTQQLQFYIIIKGASFNEFKKYYTNEATVLVCCSGIVRNWFTNLHATRC
jgi:hypothetical protein